MMPAVTTIAKGDGSGIVEPRRIAVRDAVEWRALWAAHAGPAEPAPDVDFAADMVAAAFAGERPTPGYEIEIADARRDGGALGHRRQRGASTPRDPGRAGDRFTFSHRPVAAA